MSSNPPPIIPPLAPTCLVTDILQVRAVSVINISVTLDSLMPYLMEAQDDFIRPCIGRGFLGEWLLTLNSGSPFVNVNLYDNIYRVRKPLVLYALWLAVDEFGVSFSAQGIQVVESPSHKTAPQYKVQNLKEIWLRRAHKAMDDLLEYLDSNRDLYITYLPEDPDLFIRNTAEFNQQVDIRGSRRVFAALKPIMRSIEKKYLRPTLSDSLFDEVKGQIKSGQQISISNNELLPLIQCAVAHLTIARALQEISIDILDWGIFENAQNTFESIASKASANSDKISVMVNANQADGEAELKALQEFLDSKASPDIYPLYFNSARYVGPEMAKERNEFVNKSDNSFFVA